jgi:hypothetical protein
MKIIKHRVNTINQLITTPSNFGVEIDIRTLGSDLIIHHDPFEKGVKFVDWLEYYKHDFLVVNVKEDGLEHFIFNLIKEYKIENFFYLDQPFPSLYKFSKTVPQFCAARVSDIESVESAIKLQSGWVWLDSHTGDWDYLLNAMKHFANTDIKTCLVSPELQRNNYKKELVLLRHLISNFSISFEAVCTKYPNMWINP